MRWEEVVARYPSRWLLVEALDAYSESGKRILNQIEVVEHFQDSQSAFRRYQTTHRENPEAELYVVHSARKLLEIDDVIYQGIKSLN